MKKRIKEIGAIILGIIIIIFCLYCNYCYTKTNYDRCINSNVDSNICEELLK